MPEDLGLHGDAPALVDCAASPEALMLIALVTADAALVIGRNDGAHYRRTEADTTTMKMRIMTVTLMAHRPIPR